MTASVLVVAAVILLGHGLRGAEARSSTTARLVLDFFYEPGCAECDTVREEILPLLAARYPGQYLLREWDVSVPDNYRRLLGLVEHKGLEKNVHVLMIGNGERVFAGLDQIRKELLPWVEQQVVSEIATSEADRVVAVPPTVDDSTLAARIARFTIPGVIVAGLLDGINPCAISTLIFLVSFLLVGQPRGRRLLVIGFVFCVATFLTYSVIGFGLLRALHVLAWFPVLRKAVDLVLVGMLLFFAALSVRDAVRFRRSGRSEDVVLQLSDGAKERIRRIGRAWRSGSLQIPMVFTAGVLVTAIESVCTGQIYLPTLALVVKSGTSTARGLALLGLYNLMFVVPLLMVLLIVYRGMRIAALLEWSRRNVFYSKLALGGFFLVLAAVLSWLVY
ncbi:MAG: cytochrome c biogenesis CcdA family protein [Kiritimatiellia bacterium]